MAGGLFSSYVFPQPVATIYAETCAMPHHDHDQLTLKDLLRRLPAIARRLPQIRHVQALSNMPAHQSPCGLAYTFELAAERHPDQVAVLYQQTRYTYGQFNARANQVAHYLAAQGLRRGDVVGVLLENRPELLLVVLALAKLGVIGAMLNTNQSGAALAHSIALVTPGALVVGQELQTQFEAVASQIPPLAHGVYLIEDPECSPAPPAGAYAALLEPAAHAATDNLPQTRLLCADDPCLYLYTSGTTGLPKAGVFKQGRWMKAYAAFGVLALETVPNDVVYCPLPLYHGTGLCVCWGSAIAGGAGFAIARKFSARHFWGDVEGYRATIIGYIGELCRYLLDQPVQGHDSAHLVRKMIGNGLRPGVWQAFKQRFGIEQVYEIYGASEGNIGFCNFLNFDNTIGFSLMPWELVQYDHELQAPVRGPDGFMKKVKRGEEGLLLARIDAKRPLDGYSDPQKTQQVIVENVFKPGDRYFNTGDMLRGLGFGHAQFVDRLGDTFRWKGENVATSEVENALMQSPQISEAVVYGVEIPGTNGRAGMAAITLTHPELPLDGHALFEHATTHLPRYAVPLFLRIRQQMDTTGTFKYQKKQLKEEAFAPPKAGSDRLWLLLPGADAYSPMNEEDYQRICCGQYRY